MSSIYLPLHPVLRRLAGVLPLVLIATSVFAQSAAPAATTAGATVQTPPPVAPAPRPPVPNRLNETLPSWLRVRGEFRGRLEGFENSGFTEGRDDLYWLNRFRFNANIVPSKSFAVLVQVQDARVAKKQVGPTGTPFKAPFDLRMAFADIGSTTAPVALRVGRQELAFGEQRLVGHVSWLNAARTFDAARVTVRRKNLVVDGFAASVVRIMDGAFDKSGAGNQFYGAYAVASGIVPLATVEPYVFWRGDENIRGELGTSGDLRMTTAGVRWAGKLPSNVEYGVEAAAQTGDASTDSIGAWAAHYQVRTGPGPKGFRVTGEFNHASGDADPTDGKRGTFDHLYPTPHDKYGLADQVGWRNIRHVRAGIDLVPARGWPVTANYHSWWLAETRDGLYNAGGALLARVAAGATSAHVGQELDVQVTRQITPQLQVAAGYAHIFPGKFLKEATPGASFRLPFAMVTYIFLSER